MSTLMNIAIILLLVGVIMLFNGVMLLIQRMERMKDLFCVEPALLFFLLFVYYPVIDLVRILYGHGHKCPDHGQAGILWAGTTTTGCSTSPAPATSGNPCGSPASIPSGRVMITLVGGMLLALLFNRMTRSFNVMRSIAFCQVYRRIHQRRGVHVDSLQPRGHRRQPERGHPNHALSLFGITGPHWLIDASTALTGILFLTAWRVVGYAMMIYLSAMKGIPQDYYEAAVIDGADGVQRFRYITVLLLAPTSLFLFVTTFIASMKVFQSAGRGAPTAADPARPPT